MCTIVRTAIHLRVDLTLKSRRLIFCVCCFHGLIIFLRHNCWKILKALKLHYVEVSLYQPVCSNNGIGRAHCFDSAIKFVALAALSVHAKSSLHQFAAPAARGYALVKTTPATVSMKQSVRAWRPQAELCKLGVCQQRACTRSAAIYIYHAFVIECEQASS